MQCIICGCSVQLRAARRDNSIEDVENNTASCGECLGIVPDSEHPQGIGELCLDFSLSCDGLPLPSIGVTYHE